MATFTNQATLTYNGNVTSSNIATGEIIETLTANKTALRGEYSSRDNLTFVVSLTNAGTTAETGVTVDDTLGGYDFNGTTVYPLDYVDGSVRLFINGVLQPAPAVTAGPPMAISGITVPAGGNAVIVYEASVNPYAPLAEGSTIVNNIAVNGNSIARPILAGVTVEADDAPVLSITKSVSPLTVTDNGTLTYTFVVQNAGSAEAGTADNAVITDTFDPILTNLTATFNGAPLTPGTDYTYDQNTGLFTTSPGVITVPAATYTQEPTGGTWQTDPGVSVLTVSGTVNA